MINIELNEITLMDIGGQFEDAFSKLDPNSSLSLRERKYEMVRAERQRLGEEYDRVHRDNPDRKKQALVAETLKPNIHLQVLLLELLRELE